LRFGLAEPRRYHKKLPNSAEQQCSDSSRVCASRGRADVGAFIAQAFNTITRGVGFLLRSDLLAQLHKGDEPPSVKALQTVLRDYGSLA
jgi:hypothetical protein